MLKQNSDGVSVFAVFDLRLGHDGFNCLDSGLDEGDPT